MVGLSWRASYQERTDGRKFYLYALTDLYSFVFLYRYEYILIIIITCFIRNVQHMSNTCLTMSRFLITPPYRASIYMPDWQIWQVKECKNDYIMLTVLDRLFIYVQVFKHVLFKYLEFILKESSLSSRFNTEDMEGYEGNDAEDCTMGQGWGRNHEDN